MSRSRIFAGLVVGGILASVWACGTDPVGVEACQRIEKVRCESAPLCGISLARPVHVGEGPEADVAACTRYYDDQCLHGVVVKTQPTPQAVDACVNAIINGSCDVVKAPETHPSCAFLIPPQAAAAADAASDADATSTADAASDATDGASDG